VQLATQPPCHRRQVVRQLPQNCDARPA
jgi:hypothetical protein